MHCYLFHHWSGWLGMVQITLDNLSGGTKHKPSWPSRTINWRGGRGSYGAGDGWSLGGWSARWWGHQLTLKNICDKIIIIFLRGIFELFTATFRTLGCICKKNVQCRTSSEHIISSSDNLCRRSFSTSYCSVVTICHNEVAHTEQTQGDGSANVPEKCQWQEDSLLHRDQQAIIAIPAEDLPGDRGSCESTSVSWSTSHTR